MTGCFSIVHNSVRHIRAALCLGAYPLPGRCIRQVHPGEPDRL